ncbi:hypothetical protein [Paraliobacillus ryukyuensis]|uniref:hypothetical protein n=1 Tax=Paraliobacillus ryukyuensis TaxID=200904 RepID=UPI0009A7FCAE|nr:hypothetical protein [Paraliobacillus ryukyuensis]
MVKLESSEEITRMFNKEISTQKRIGRGSHNKVSRGEKAKSSGYWRGLSNFKGQPNKKNSKTKVSNLYIDIMNYRDFKNLNRGRQKELLLRWMKNNTNRHIAESMGISETSFYNIKNKLINEEKGASVVADKIINRKEFNKLSPKEKNNLLDKYLNDDGFTYEELADYWGYKSSSSLKSSRSQWRKAARNEQETIEDEAFIYNQENKEESDYDMLGVGSSYSQGDSGEENKISSPENTEIKQDNIDKFSHELNDDFSFLFELKNEDTGSVLANKLRAIAQLIDDDDAYHVELLVGKNE